MPSLVSVVLASLQGSQPDKAQVGILVNTYDQHKWFWIP